MRYTKGRERLDKVSEAHQGQRETEGFRPKPVESSYYMPVIDILKQCHLALVSVR